MTKATSLFLAALGCAGFLYRGQLQSLVGLDHQAPAGVYYLRAAQVFPVPGGMARWAPGQELRAAVNPSTDADAVALTDGRNTAQVPRTAVTRNMDDAAALRQGETAGQNAAWSQVAASPPAGIAQQANTAPLIAGQFHSTVLDAPAVSTNRWENIVSTAASAPVIYPVYRTEIIQPVYVAPPRVIVQQQQQTRRQTQRQATTPPHQVILHGGN